MHAPPYGLCGGTRGRSSEESVVMNRVSQEEPVTEVDGMSEPVRSKSQAVEGFHDGLCNALCAKISMPVLS